MDRNRPCSRCRPTASRSGAGLKRRQEPRSRLLNLFTTSVQPTAFQNLANMGVTELALLKIIATTDSALLQNLAHAKQVLESYTQQPFHFFSQIEDPTSIYIIGGWDSPEQHWNDFIPSPTNQNLLNLLKGQVTVESVFHIDTPQASLPFHAPILSIVRQSVNPGKKEAFDELFNSAKRSLEGAEEPGGRVHGIRHGWRIEKEDGNKDEVVIFAGCDSVLEHSELSHMPKHEEFGELEPLIAGAKVARARMMEL